MENKVMKKDNYTEIMEKLKGIDKILKEIEERLKVTNNEQNDRTEN